MAPEVRTTSVHILGNEYKIRSSEDGDFVREVALYVDELMHQISSKMTTGTTSQIAVLAALNLAEELFRERRNPGGNGNGPNEADSRMSALVARIDEIIEGVSADLGEERVVKAPRSS
jgi:cell division protein ZapA